MARLLGPAAGRPTLPDLLATGEMVLAPGCYDALGARLVEEAGFDAAYMTGFGTAAARLGRPDVGLLTLTEMADNARRLAQAVEIPVIADADTGYGNPINVIRTVQEYEAAGVAAVHIEDQVMPKKCGHMEGKQLIGADEMVAKVEAAIERARSYREAGADVLFIEAPQSLQEIETIAASFENVPLLFNYAEGGKTPPVSHEQLRRLGFSIVIFPISTLLTATAAIRAALAQIKADGTPIELLGEMLPFNDFLDFIGLPEIRELEERFATDPTTP